MKKGLKNTTQKKIISTKIIDDVFTDEVSHVKPRFEVNYDAYLDRLWKANPKIYKLLLMVPTQQLNWREKMNTKIKILVSVDELIEPIQDVWEEYL